MASVFDVAQYILQKQGTISALKLQKLVYYCQAWSLVWDGKPLFHENIEAWANGPVVPDLYQLHKGKFEIQSLTKGNPSNLNHEEVETIDAILKYYGDKSAQWLCELAHMETPWVEARGSTPFGAPCQNEISCASMAEYYMAVQLDG